MHTLTYLTNNVEFQQAPQNLIEMLVYQKFLDDRINNIRPRDIRDIKKSFLAEMTEFDEETPESHKTWKKRDIDNKKILEELTDVYFFLAQMINYLYENNSNIFQGKEPLEKKNILVKIDYDFRVGNHSFTDDKKDVYLDITEAVSKRIININYILQLLGHFTYLYGFTEEDIYKSYYRKWKKNLERIGKEWR